MKYNVIGDIHGRDAWKKLVLEDAVNIFVGDYFDPYDPYTFEELEKNFLEIVEYVRLHPGNVMLFGNHDLHYFHRDDHSRLDGRHIEQIQQLFLKNIDVFEIGYQISNQVLITHAGVSKQWLDMSGFQGELTPKNVLEHMEALFWNTFTECSNGECYWDHPKMAMKFFEFSTCADIMDNYGTTPTQSPMWLRPQTLAKCNAFIDEQVTQVVGHTQVMKIDIDATSKYKFILVDCLGQHPQSLTIESNNGIIVYGVNDIRKE